MPSSKVLDGEQAEKQVLGDKWQSWVGKCLLSDGGLGFVWKRELPLCSHCQLLQGSNFQQGGMGEVEGGERFMLQGDASG